MYIYISENLRALASNAAAHRISAEHTVVWCTDSSKQGPKDLAEQVPRFLLIASANDAAGVNLLLAPLRRMSKAASPLLPF